APVQAFSGGRLLLGLGVGHRVVNASLGIEMGDPLVKLRDVVATCRNGWTKGPFQPRLETPPKILVAAIASTAIETGGEIADGVIFNLFPLSRYAKAVEFTLCGPADACRERLDAYARAGATMTIAFPNPVGEPRAAASLRAIEGLAPK